MKLYCQESCCEHQPVVAEVLKAEDVKQAYWLSDHLGILKWLVNGAVDFVHDPKEKSSINSLDK